MEIVVWQLPWEINWPELYYAYRVTWKTTTCQGSRG